MCTSQTLIEYILVSNLSLLRLISRMKRRFSLYKIVFACIFHCVTYRTLLHTTTTTTKKKKIEMKWNERGDSKRQNERIKGKNFIVFIIYYAKIRFRRCEFTEWYFPARLSEGLGFHCVCNFSTSLSSLRCFAFSIHLSECISMCQIIENSRKRASERKRVCIMSNMCFLYLRFCLHDLSFPSICHRIESKMF